MALNKQRSHKHKKFSRYTASPAARKKSFSLGLWWLIPLSALVAFVLALLLGNCLGNKADSTRPPEETGEISSEKETDAPLPEKGEMHSIHGVFVGLEGIKDNTYSMVAEQIPEDASAVSVSMFLSNGAPLYYSDAAKAFGKECGELTLKNIFGYANDKGMYISVPFPSKAMALSGEITFGAAAAYEAELINELYEAGADEVIIKIADFGESGLSEEDADHLVKYLETVRRRVPRVKLGLMISINDVCDPELSAVIRKLDGYADFIAADLTACDSPEALRAAAQDGLAEILRYEMRALIRDGEAGDELCKVLDTLGILNRQFAVR